ncbi:MAG: AAA family ATPase [Burkholderiales bacterium]|nr:AAA family ATPase [Burkholderiales bacterium]
MNASADPGSPGATAGAAGRRHYLTVLFADLSDSTEIGTDLEAELYAQLLAEVRAAMRRLVVHHGGRIARLQGDGVLAVFGLPAPGEDDGRRACEAALDLHAAVAGMTLQLPGREPVPLALHSGIHAGLTYVLPGSAEVGAMDLVGDVPNVAARLSSLAGRGEIVVSTQSLGDGIHFFEATAPESARLRGRPRPLPICRVLRRQAMPRRFEARAARGLAPFIGREGEMAQLEAALEAAAAGAPQCAAVIGGPGLGKTRLVEELMQAARTRGVAVLHGYCESYLGAEPLQPFLQILRGLIGLAPGTEAAAAAQKAQAVLTTQIGLAADSAAALRRALSLPLPDEAAPRAEAGTTVLAVARLVERLAARATVLLVLDDWQWADEHSQRVLDGLLALPAAVCAVLVTRPEAEATELLPTAARRLVLAPLALAQTRQALAHLLPGADPFAVAEIHRYAGGVPLFIEELCHSMAAPRALDAPADTAERAAWLAALVVSRVERLEAEPQRVVQVAAVIGTLFPVWLLERLTGCGEHSPVLQSLAANDLVFPSAQAGVLRFKHGVTRDVVYEAVGLHERQAIHRQVAQALRERGDDGSREDLLEALAYQHAAGGQPAEAARYAELAGDKAAAAFALDRARVQYAAALKALDALAPLSRTDRLRWCRLAEKLGLACVFDPLALADGVSLFERGLALAESADEAPAVARARYWLGYLHYARGQTRPALAHCQAALAMAEQLGDERLAAQVRATLGQALQCAADYGRALPLIDAALDLKRARGRPGSSVAVGSAYSLACKGAMLGDRGEFDAADDCFAQALELLGDSAHLVGSSVRNWASCTWQWQGRWADAERIAADSMRVAEQGKSRQLLAMSRALWGHAQWRLARERKGGPQDRPGADGLQALLDATRWIEERRGALVTSLNYGYLVSGAVAEGRLGDARRHAARLWQRARQRDRLGEPMGCRALAGQAARQGDFARAERLLRQAGRAADARGSPHEQAANALCRAEVEALRGAPHRAAALSALDAAGAAFEALGMRWHLQQALDLRARL